MRKAIAASILGMTALGGASPDIPSAVMSRLPTYCRYDVDIRNAENPYRLLAKVAREDDVTCPYNAGSSDTAQLYRLRGDSPCAAGDLPGLTLLALHELDGQTARREIAEIRHSSLYAPRDFDISPYFMVVKPTLARGFKYKDMHWADLPEVLTAQVTLAPEIEDAIAEVA